MPSSRTTKGLPFPLPPALPGFRVLPGRDAGTCWDFTIAYVPSATVETIIHLLQNLEPGHQVCFERPGPEDAYLLVRRTDAVLELKTAFHGASGSWAGCSLDQAVEFLRPTLAHIDAAADREYASYTVYPGNGH